METFHLKSDASVAASNSAPISSHFFHIMLALCSLQLMQYYALTDIQVDASSRARHPITPIIWGSGG